MNRRNSLSAIAAALALGALGLPQAAAAADVTLTYAFFAPAKTFPAVQMARQSAARFLNAGSAGEIVFTPGATASLNLVAHAFGSTLKAGDRVLISVAEHHSNFVPWQMLRWCSALWSSAISISTATSRGSTARQRCARQ